MNVPANGRLEVELQGCAEGTIELQKQTTKDAEKEPTLFDKSKRLGLLLH
jgi:hypothetical protein